MNIVIYFASMLSILFLLHIISMIFAVLYTLSYVLLGELAYYLSGVIYGKRESDEHNR
jgi:hypothetical protein